MENGIDWYFFGILKLLLNIIIEENDLLKEYSENVCNLNVVYV